MKKNLITALKKLVTSFGGSAESNNAVDLVDEFADVATQLPEANATDAGKTIIIDENGNYVLAEMSGGVEIITISFDANDNCSKTVDQIYEAYKMGKLIWCNNTASFAYIQESSNKFNQLNVRGCVFGSSDGSRKPSFLGYIIRSNGSVTKTQQYLTLAE